MTGLLTSNNCSPPLVPQYMSPEGPAMTPSGPTPLSAQGQVAASYLCRPLGRSRLSGSVVHLGGEGGFLLPWAGQLGQGVLHPRDTGCRAARCPSRSPTQPGLQDKGTECPQPGPPAPPPPQGPGVLALLSQVTLSWRVLSTVTPLVGNFT